MATKEDPNDPVLRALLEAPEDDEPLSKDEEQAINEARMDILAGRTVVLKDVDEIRSHFHSLMEQTNQTDRQEE